MRNFSALALILFVPPTLADDFNNKKSALCALGDIDKDGVPDLALASRDVQRQDFDEPVRVIRGPAEHIPERIWLISGKTGALLLTLSGARDGDGFGSALANAGDVDEDGIDDLVVGCVPLNWFDRWNPSKSCVRVFSCATGAQLFEIQAGSHKEELGTSVAGLGDLDGDGVPEFAASAPFGAPLHASDDGKTFDWRPGFVRVYSGIDGSLLYQIEGWNTGVRVGESFGTCICPLGDLDDDGRPDFAVSAPGRYSKLALPLQPRATQEDWETEPRCGSQDNAGSVLIYSGRCGREIARIDRTTPRGHYGWTLAPAGDVDGDGKPDLLVGTLNSNVDVVSGATRKVLHHRTIDDDRRFDPYGYATSLASVGDVDGDASPDFVVGANEEDWRPDPGSVILSSGRTGKAIWNFSASSRPGAKGARVRNSDSELIEGFDACGCGDVNSDGTPDVAVVTQFSRELLFLSGKDRVLIRAVQIRDLEK